MFDVIVRQQGLGKNKVRRMRGHSKYYTSCIENAIHCFKMLIIIENP